MKVNDQDGENRLLAPNSLKYGSAKVTKHKGQPQVLRHTPHGSTSQWWVQSLRNAITIGYIEDTVETEDSQDLSWEGKICLARGWPDIPVILRFSDLSLISRLRSLSFGAGNQGAQPMGTNCDTDIANLSTMGKDTAHI